MSAVAGVEYSRRHLHQPDRFTRGIQISGPSAIGNGGEAEWTITAAPGKAASHSPPNPAVFYTGALAKSPLAARLTAAGLPSSEFETYGVIGTTTVGITSWNSNDLIGLKLVGNQLVIADFTDSTGKDGNVTVAQIIYTFMQ